MKISLRVFQSARRRLKAMHAECALPTCPNILLTRSMTPSQVGIRVGQLWYCSVDCFAGAANRRFATFSSGRVVEMPHNPRMSIGLVLLSKGILNDHQLRLAIAQSQSKGEELEKTLLRLSLVNESQLTAAKATQWGYPVFGQEGMSRSIEIDIPAALLRSYQAAPLHYAPRAKRLVLGFVNRVEHSLLESVEQMTGCRAEPCFISPTKFGEQMDLVTTVAGYEEITVDVGQTPAQMARTVAGYAQEISAKEANFVQHKGVIWARLAGNRRKIDVLFRDQEAQEATKSENFTFWPKTFAL